MTDLEKLEQQVAELQKTIATMKETPKYPDGTFGYFGSSKICGFLKNIGRGVIERYEDRELTLNGFKYPENQFKPETEALLPVFIEYNGGDYPGNPEDFIFTVYKNGCETWGRAKSKNWGNVSKYKLIKKENDND